MVPGAQQHEVAEVALKCRHGPGGALYARISSDHDGTRLGVERQLEDCRRAAAELRWPVVDVYVDNDLSAFSGKRRPEYERMLADLANGTRDAVVVYHLDRLTRRPIELEHFVKVLDRANVKSVHFVHGNVDVGSGDGLMMARVQAAFAAHESAAKSRGVKRNMVEVAASGRPHGGSRRPFGYDDDKVTVREDEAKIVRSLVDRYGAGESWRSLANCLNEQGVPTHGAQAAVIGGTPGCGRPGRNQPDEFRCYFKLTSIFRDLAAVGLRDQRLAVNTDRQRPATAVTLPPRSAFHVERLMPSTSSSFSTRTGTSVLQTPVSPIDLVQDRG